MKSRGQQLAQNSFLPASEGLQPTLILQGRALRATVAIAAAIIAVSFVFGIIADHAGHDARYRKQADSLIEDLSTMAADIPRLPSGEILRQGQLSSAWLDENGALPVRFQEMAGSLRGQQDQHSLGLVSRGPGAYAPSFEAKDSLIWTVVPNLSKAGCLQMFWSTVRRSGQIAYIATNGDPPTPPYLAEPTSTCRSDFVNFTLITGNPDVELGRLAADIGKAVAAFSNSSQDKAPVSGTSALFRVTPQGSGSNYIERDGSGVRIALSKVPLAVCRLALLAGPRAFGMDHFQATDGSTMKVTETLGEAEALCEAQSGRLVMNRL
jgi:hypothetical protein